MSQLFVAEICHICNDCVTTLSDSNVPMVGVMPCWNGPMPIGPEVITSDRRTHCFDIILRYARCMTVRNVCPALPAGQIALATCNGSPSPLFASITIVRPIRTYRPALERRMAATAHAKRLRLSPALQGTTDSMGRGQSGATGISNRLVEFGFDHG